MRGFPSEAAVTLLTVVILTCEIATFLWTDSQISVLGGR